MNKYITNITNYLKLPGYSFSYWVKNQYFHIFEMQPIGAIAKSGGRNKTHNNEKYVRCWWEIKKGDSNWRLYSNGGEYRKWYGNIQDVVNWSPKAIEFYESKGGLLNRDYWNVEGITWNDISKIHTGYRIKPKESIFSSVSPTLVFNDKKMDYAMLAFLNSKVAEWINAITNSTLHTLVGDVLTYPNLSKGMNLNSQVINCIELSKNDWDGFEVSSNFQKHPLI